MAIGSLANTQYSKFVEFATGQMQFGNSKAVARFGAEGPLGNRTLKAAAPRQDWVGHVRRNDSEKTLNDSVRTSFRNAIADMFGGMDHVPESVKKMMCLDDYGQGKPLTARRIVKVKAEVDKFAARFQPAFDAAKSILDGHYAEGDREIVADEALADGKSTVTRDQLHELANTALKRAVADKDALDVVSKCILGIIKGGDGNFRSAEGIAQKVDAILANIAELRTAAKGNRAVVEAGKNMIVAMKGKGLPDGLFAKMAEAALKMKTGDVLKLSASASGLQFHRAIERFADNINYGMNTSGATKLLDGAEELEVARGFFAEIHFAKCSASTLNRMRDALNSDTASKLAKVYLSLSNGDINPGADLSEVHRDQVVYQSDVAMQMMNHLKTVVDIKCGVPENELTQLRIFNGNFDFEDVDAFEVRKDLQTRASTTMERTRREFLENCVKGKGAGADVMRGIYGNKIGPEVGNPALDLKREMSKNSMTMIGWAVMSDCKKFAEGNVEGTYFFRDIKRQLDIRLPGDVKLSEDFETARNQIAAFVTNGAKTTYASLSDKEKVKSHVVMSLLTQEISKAAFTGSAIALHPTGSAETFMAPQAIPLPGEAPRNSYAYTLSLTEDGGLKLNFRGKLAIDVFMPGDPSVDFPIPDVGPGSVLEANISLQINAGEIDRLCELDYSKFDATDAQNLYRSQEADKMNKIYDGFPKEYRLDDKKVSCSTTFIATFN